MERRSRELPITPNSEIVIPSEGGLLKYPADAVLTAHAGRLDNNGSFSKIKDGAGCRAIIIILKKVE